MPICNNIDSDYTRSCGNVSSGIKEIYLTNYSAGTTWAKTGAGQVTGGTGVPTFYQYEIRQKNSSATEEGIINDQFGSININQNLTIVLLGYGDQTVRQAANNLLGSQMVALIKTEDDKWLLFGEGSPLEVSATNGASGVQAGEFAGINLTISAQASDYAPTISTAYAATLTA